MSSCRYVALRTNVVLQCRIFFSLMICVLCKHPVASTHSTYKGDYIKLLVCDKCHNVVDKYIEYDNVLLFLDILLLKPQAYRHFCYNFMEPLGGQAGRILARFFAIMVLFEVYLQWAYEEKKSEHGKLIFHVLQQPLAVQYLVFIVQVIVRNIVFIGIIMAVSQWWNRGTPALLVVVATTVLVANGIKLVPILMLIWPYDTTIPYKKVVVFMAAMNVMESLNSVTDLGYSRIIRGYIMAVCLLEVACQTAVAVFVGLLEGNSAGDMVIESYYDVLRNIKAAGKVFIAI